MNVGLPGTGIGGLFYLTLALLMPLHELWKTMRGTGSVRGWKTAVFHMSVAVAILSALWLEGSCIERALATPFAQRTLLPFLLRGAHVLPDQRHLIAVGSIVTLGTLLLLVHGAGEIARLRRVMASQLSQVLERT